MQVILFVGDVYLERIPQYAVAAIKLHVEMFGEAITLSGKWSRKSRQIRFQDTVHMMSASVIDSIELIFTLIALQSTEKSDYRVIGSGSVQASLANHSVLQTVMLSSSDMSNLMARLEMKVDFESSKLMRRDILDDGRAFKSNQRQATGQKVVADSSIQNLMIKESRSAEYGGSRNSRDRSSSRSRTFVNRYDSLHSTADGRVDIGHKRRSSDAITERGQKISENSRSHVSKETEVRPSARSSSQKVENSSRRFESLNQVTERAKHRSEEREFLSRSTQGINVYNSVQIQTETMKEVEAFGRLRLALERKDEMLRKAQSQLENSVSVRGHEWRARGDSGFMERSAERVNESRSWREESNDISIDDRERSHHRREQSGRHAVERMTPRHSEVLSRSQEKRIVPARSNRVSDKHSKNNGWVEEEKREVEGVDVSTRSNNASLRLSSSLTASNAELIRAAKASLDAREKQIEERRTQEIRNRLQSAEDRRMAALRSHKDRATQMSSEATCKAKAIKEAALMSSRAYDKMRNDFDRKEEMLRRVQDEYRKIGGPGFNQRSRSREGRLNLSTDGSPLKLVKVTKVGQGEAVRRRASSAPPRARIQPAPTSKGRSIPFSNLKRRSRSSSRSESYRARRGAIAAGEYDADQRTSYQSSQHVHYIPTVYPSRSAFTPLRTENPNSMSSVTLPLPPNRTQSEPPAIIDAAVVDGKNFDRSFQSITMEGEESVRETSFTGGSKDSFLDPNLSRKKMARLVHQRVYALKQKIAEVSPAEGESILRMIRNVLPPSSARSRAKHGKKGKRRKPSVVSAVPAGTRLEAFHEAREQLHLGEEADSRDSGEWGRGPSDPNDAAHDVVSDGSDSEGEGEDVGDADSVETSTLVSQLWEILGVTAEYSAPIRNLSQRERVFEHVEERNEPTYQAISRGNGEYMNGDRERDKDRSAFRSHIAQMDETVPIPPVANGWKTQPPAVFKPFDSISGTPQPPTIPRQLDLQGKYASPPTAEYVEQKKPIRYSKYNAESSVLSSEQKDKEGRGERWWKTDYLALKGEIKHIIESASPLKQDPSSLAAYSGRVKAVRPHGDAPHIPPQTPSSSSRAWESDPRSSEDRGDRDPPSAVPSKRHVAFSSIDQLDDSLLPSAPPSAFAYRNSDQRRAVFSELPVSSTIGAVDRFNSERSLPLRPSSTEKERMRAFQISEDHDRSRQGEDYALKDSYGDSSVSEDMEATGDPFAVDTSACISRQIDDVGKAISTLQARIASYMYISPDASPGDGLITARRAARQAEKEDAAAGSQILLVSGIGSPISEGGRVVTTAALGETLRPEVVDDPEPEHDGRAVYWPLSATGILDDSVVEDCEDDNKTGAGALGVGVGVASGVASASPRGSPESVTGSETASHTGSELSANQLTGRRLEPIVEGRERAKAKERSDHFGIKAWQQRYAARTSISEDGSTSNVDADSDSALAPDTHDLRPSLDSAESPAPTAFPPYTTQQQSRFGVNPYTRGTSSNIFHGLLFSGGAGTGTGTGTGTNTEDASVSVRDMDVGNLSYDTMSFAADRMMALGQSSLVDLNNTEDLLKDIFGDDDVDSESEAEGQGQGQVLSGRVDKSRYPLLAAVDAGLDSDSESNSDDFDGVFRLP